MYVKTTIPILPVRKKSYRKVPIGSHTEHTWLLAFELKFFVLQSNVISIADCHRTFCISQSFFLLSPSLLFYLFYPSSFFIFFALLFLRQPFYFIWCEYFCLYSCNMCIILYVCIFYLLNDISCSFWLNMLFLRFLRVVMWTSNLLLLIVTWYILGMHPPHFTSPSSQ